MILEAKRSPFPITILVNAGLAMGVAILVVAASLFGLLHRPDLRGYDLLIAGRGVLPMATEVIVVDFDDASVDKFNAFPIPRQLLREVIQKVSAGGAALIGLDVILDKHRDAEDDARLAQAIRESGNVILAEVYATDQIPEAWPLADFTEAALASGFVNTPKDEDGLIRRMPLVVRMENYEGISFSAALATNYVGHPLEPYRPGLLRLGEREIPVDPFFAILIGGWGPPPAKIYSVASLLSEDFDPAVFDGKIVVIGNSSIAAKDLYDTPVSTTRVRGSQFQRQLSGAEIHVAAATTLITGNVIFTMPLLWQWMISVSVVWVCLLLIERLRPYYSVLVILLSAFGVFWFALYLFAAQQVWFPFAGTELGIGLAWPAGLGYRYYKIQKVKAEIEEEKQSLMGLFEQYMSPEVAAEILHKKLEGGVTNEARIATVLFSDIRDFTALTSGKSPTEVLAWLNRYFSAMSEVIKENNGHLNKFMGDGMLVVFGVPKSNGVAEDAENAVRAARQMMERVESLNATRRSGEPSLSMGVGIHTGSLTVGNVGAWDRMEYSVIGETVNLASRLESLTKDLGVKIILSPETQQYLQDGFETQSLGEVEIRGVKGKIGVYTVQ